MGKSGSEIFAVGERVRGLYVESLAKALHGSAIADFPAGAQDGGVDRTEVIALEDASRVRDEYSTFCTGGGRNASGRTILFSYTRRPNRICVGDLPAVTEDACIG